MEDPMMQSQKTISAPKDHLLLPKAHVHYFAQVVLFVIGLLSLVSGIVLYVIGTGETSVLGVSVGDATKEAAVLLFYLGVTGLMGIGVACLVVWALWKFVSRYRIRFAISIALSTLAIVSALLSVAGATSGLPEEYAYYFFALTSGLLLGVSSLYFFFIGMSRHVFGTHRYDTKL